MQNTLKTWEDIGDILGGDLSQDFVLYLLPKHSLLATSNGADTLCHVIIQFCKTSLFYLCSYN